MFLSALPVATAITRVEYALPYSCLFLSCKRRARCLFFMFENREKLGFYLTCSNCHNERIERRKARRFLPAFNLLAFLFSEIKREHFFLFIHRGFGKKKISHLLLQEGFWRNQKCSMSSMRLLSPCVRTHLCHFLVLL